jgi:hypothetical protein
LPASSTSTHRVVTHETPNGPWPASSAVEVQSVALLATGSVDTDTPPSYPDATHNGVEETTAQEIPVSEVMMSVRVQLAVPPLVPAGLVETSTPPSLSIATHSEIEAQEIPVTEPFVSTSFSSFQSEATSPAGVEVVNRSPF